MPNLAHIRRRDSRIALLAGAVTAALFAVYAFVLFPSGLQFGKYPAAAEGYVAGLLPAERIPDFSPLYFYLHVLRARYLEGGAQAVALLHVAAVSCSSSLLYLLLRRHAGVALSVVGVAGFALNRSLALYACLYEPEVLLVFFLLLFLWAIDSHLAHRELLAGLALSFCLLTRPNLLPVVVVVPFWLYLRRRQRPWRRAALVFLALPALALSVLSWRNHAVGAGLSPVVMNPGFVFYEANQPLASGQSAVYPPLVAELRIESQGEPDAPHAIYRTLARTEAGVQLSTASVNQYWWAKAVAFITDHPAHWLGLELRKLHALWHEHRRYDLLQAFRFDRVLSVPHVPLALISASALIGLVVAFGRWREYLLHYALLAVQAASMLAFYVSDRQRLTLLPLYVIFGCIAGTAALTYSGPRRVALGIVMATLATLFSWPSDRMRDDEHLWESEVRIEQLWRDAGRLRELGHVQEAAEMYALSFAAAPWVEEQSRPDHASYEPAGFAGRAVELWPKLGRSGPSARFDLGILQLAAGRLDDAERTFHELRSANRRFDRGHLQSSLPQYYLGEVALRRGASGEARRWFERCLDESPGEPFALAQLAVVTGAQRYRDQLVRYFGTAESDWLLGRAMLQQGKPADAAETLARFNGRLPGFRRGMIYLAAAQGAAGDWARGAALYLSATQDRPAPLMLEAPILAMFSRVAEAQPGNPTAHEWQGLVLSAFGHFREGREALERSRSLRSSSP